MRLKLKETITLLPPNPGVYKFIDEKGTTLYIGKAVNLKSRVASYFREELTDRPWVLKMLPLISNIEYTETDNEIEALILESALIKQLQPKYNSDLKDDKSYAWLYINTKDTYPTIKIVRNITKGETKKGMLFGPYPSGTSIKRVFSYIRKIYPFCTSKEPTKPCFHSRIGLCPGPDTSPEEYRKNIDGIIMFLKGNSKRHIANLEKEMHEYSQQQNFEKAAQLRDEISDLKYLGSEIRFTYFNTENEYKEHRESRALKQITTIAKELSLPKVSRIECYDISNIQGKFSVGSMVVSVNGIPRNSEYRIFKVKNIEGANDPEMLRHVIERRVRHIGLGKDESLSSKPDIMLIDGGKGQLSVLRDTIPEGIFVLGITKGRKYRRRGGRMKDEFWVYSGSDIDQITLRNTTVLSVLRDEAHRFAISHHRRLRKESQKKSILDGILGVGPISKKKLMLKFGSVDEIRKATAEDLHEIIKSKKTVSRIIQTLSDMPNSKTN